MTTQNNRAHLALAEAPGVAPIAQSCWLGGGARVVEKPATRESESRGDPR
jgi:hypothetical protein